MMCKMDIFCQVKCMATIFLDPWVSGILLVDKVSVLWNSKAVCAACVIPTDQARCPLTRGDRGRGSVPDSSQPPAYLTLRGRGRVTPIRKPHWGLSAAPSGVSGLPCVRPANIWWNIGFVLKNLCAWHTAVFTQPSVFLVLQWHIGTPMGMVVPAAFPGVRFSLSSLRVMSATTPPCVTVIALDSSDP